MKKSSSLAVLTGSEYAEHFYSMAGRYPRFVPAIRYYHGEV